MFKNIANDTSNTDDVSYQFNIDKIVNKLNNGHITLVPSA